MNQVKVFILLLIMIYFISGYSAIEKNSSAIQPFGE